MDLHNHQAVVKNIISKTLSLMKQRARRNNSNGKIAAKPILSLNSPRMRKHPKVWIVNLLVLIPKALRLSLKASTSIQSKGRLLEVCQTLIAPSLLALKISAARIGKKLILAAKNLAQMNRLLTIM